MATRAARYALPFFGDDDGRLIGLPGASILIREAGTVIAAPLWADRAKTTALANPLPTGVVRGAAGLDIDGNAVFYADPGDDDGSTVYEAMVTVGNNTVGPVSIGTIPPDMADVASPVALAAVEADIATKADAAATTAALAGKQATIPAGTYAGATQTRKRIRVPASGDQTGVTDAAALTAAVQSASDKNIVLDDASYYVLGSSPVAVLNVGRVIEGSGPENGTKVFLVGAGDLIRKGTENAITRTDGAVGAASTAFTGSGFVAGDVGKYISIAGAGATGSRHTTTIAAYVSPTAVTLTLAATTAVGPSASYTINPHDANLYDGPSRLVLRNLTLDVLNPTTTLDNGAASYTPGTYGIRDYRGGSVILDHVTIQHFDFPFWGVQSDVNEWNDVQLKFNHSGAYLGPRSDQLTARGLYTLFNDRALDLDRVKSVRLFAPQFVDDGNATTNPIRIRSAWAEGSFGVHFYSPWFEYLIAGTTQPDAFVDFGVGDLVRSNDLVIHEPTVYTNATGSPTTHVKYLVKCGNGDRITVHNPHGRDFPNLEAVVAIAGAVSPNIDLDIASQAIAVASTVILAGATGTAANLYRRQWGGGGLRTWHAPGGESFSTGTIVVGSNSVANPSVTVNGTAASTRTVSAIQTAGSNRWLVRGTSTAESGANAGTDLEWVARDDAGANLGTAMTLTRSNGVLSTLKGHANMVKAGTPSDADFATAPPNGTVVIDTTASKIWVRIGGGWKSTVALT